MSAMPTTQNRFTRARKHLELFEDIWKFDHADAMRCRDFEEFLAEAVMVFGLLDDVCQRRREHVYRAMEEPNPEHDAAEKELYSRWLNMVESQIGQLETLERAFGIVEGADKVRAGIQRARSFLQTWTPAVQAMALGSRVVEFSEEDADQIHAILNAPPGSPGHPARPPRSIPKGDPSLLK
jgi:hypothetical protein